MKKFIQGDNNKGFSLVELVVIIAIMALGVGAISLSVSLVTGSEAKKAFEKLESQLDETKTGAMSRYDETLKIEYHVADTSYDDTSSEGSGTYDKTGFYAVKEITTLGADTTEDSDHPKIKEVSLGVEQVYLADQRVKMTITVKDPVSHADTSYEISDVGGTVTFAFDRATGLYKEVTGEAVDGSTFSGEPVSFTAKSGIKTYKMEFVKETGRHIRVDAE